ncbi:MAG: tRNA pseudouridine(55) synthase TruB, partial [Alkalispirochaeta sp.]
MKNGVLLLDKPTGISSARALYPVKRRFPRRKIGHTGTLDPFASGLLVVLVGYATRLSRFFLSMDKRYTATVVFGMETDTLDPEGEIVARAPVPTPDRVAAVIPRFHGKIEQVPPRYSALKIGGTRAYRAARAGEE